MLLGNIFQKWKEHLSSNLVPLFYRPAEIAQEDLHKGCPKKVTLRLLLELKNLNIEKVGLDLVVTLFLS